MRRNRYGKPRGRKWRIVLEPAEREFLRAERRSHCEGIRKRIAVVLEANEARGRKVRTNAEVAARAGVSEATVTNVCRDYCEGGLARLLRYGRGGGSDTARLRATGDVEAAIIAKACSPAPEGRSRWTLTLLEQEMTVVLEDGWSPSRATIGRVLSRNELRPHINLRESLGPKAHISYTTPRGS